MEEVRSRDYLAELNFGEAELLGRELRWEVLVGEFEFFGGRGERRVAGFGSERVGLVVWVGRLLRGFSADGSERVRFYCKWKVWTVFVVGDVTL
jgi:hypothetical protein